MSFLAVAIPTYKRTHLLKLLLLDLLQQEPIPDHFIIVDGDPDSGSVCEMLTATIQDKLHVAYVPSNHGNLSYQRYLAWRVAAELGAVNLIYFDDDLRLHQPNVLEWLIRPLNCTSDVVGVGCYSRVPAFGHDPAMNHLVEKTETRLLVRFWGASVRLKLKPGDITPIGHRIALEDHGQNYVESKWLQGRTMAYRMSAIDQSVFSDDLFALDHIRCGLGEDTFLSRRVGAHGKLLYTFRAIADHPNADTPKSYPYEAYKFAYAATYSRRLMNDYYRVYEPPTLADRWFLARSYVGIVLLSWIRAFMAPNKTNLALARGRTWGAIHGLVRSPTAKRLTPDIDWWDDADKALKNMTLMQKRTP